MNLLIYKGNNIQIYRDFSVLWYRLAGTPPDWWYCQINSIIIDYRYGIRVNLVGRVGLIIKLSKCVKLLARYAGIQ